MRTNLFELSCEDDSAVCVLFVDGRQAALGRGKATAKARSGARVRWAVIPRKRGTSLLVTLKRGEATRVLFDGPCSGSIETGTARVAAESKLRRVA